MQQTTSTVQTDTLPRPLDLRHVIEVMRHRLMPPNKLVLIYRGEIVGWLDTDDHTVVLMSEPWKPNAPKERDRR